MLGGMLMFSEDETIILDQPTYIPDQELYPGQSFPSYVEMKEACPLLEVKHDILDKRGLPYTPYRVTSDKKV